MKKQVNSRKRIKKVSVQPKLPWFARHFYLYPMLIVTVVILTINHLIQTVNIPYLIKQTTAKPTAGSQITAVSPKPVVPVTISPMPIPKKVTVKLPKKTLSSICDQDAWVYVIDGDLYYACSLSDKPVLLGSSDGKEKGKWFEQPQFVSSDTISFQECGRREFLTSSGVPYTCYFVKYNLVTGEETPILEFNSRPNSSGYEMSETIRQYSWDRTFKKLVYVVENYDDNTMDVILHDVEKKTSLKITTFPMFGGREIGPDDELKTTFSPDNTKLIVQTMSSIQDDRSHDSILTKILDISAEPMKVIWENPKLSTSNTRFLGSDKFVAKDIPLVRDKEGQLFRIDLQSGQETLRMPAHNWHQIDPIDDHTILFWQYDSNYVPQVVKYDLATNQPLQIWDNLYLDKLLTNKKALVVKSEKCTEGGQQPDHCPISGEPATGVLDLETGIVKVAGTPDLVNSSYYQSYDFYPVN